MRVLITGISGFVAGHLRDELEARGHVVHGLDRTPGADHVVDIRDAEDTIAAICSGKPDLVVHTAAQVGRVFGEDDHRHTVTTNALGTINVARAAKEAMATLLYFSTSEVYGDQGDALCLEEGPLALPHNLYGLSKRWGEEAAMLYASAVQVIRLSMPYGPGLPAGRGRAAIVNFLDQAMRRERIPVHVGAERSWCWVGDAVAGVADVAERGQIWQPGDPAGYGVYNVGRDDDARPMREVAAMCCDLVGAPHSLIDDVPAPAAQTVVKRLSTEKLGDLGWRPKVELREGLERTLAAMLMEEAA